ncbi:TPA: glycosyltransferase [Photobacterium damselae]
MLSIVICTYNRDNFIKNAIDKVITQIERHEAEIELIIIDNNSTDSTHTICELYKDKYDFFSYHMEANQGLSYARNRGINEANYEYVAFLDDDGYVDDEWLDTVLYEIAAGQFHFFGGPYYPWYKDGKKWWYHDDFGSNCSWLKPLERRELLDITVSGGNCCFEKSIIKNVGGFNTNLGMKGNNVAYGEETEVQIKIRELGYRIGLVPNMKLLHYVPLKKQRLSWFWVRKFSEGRDAKKYLKNSKLVSFILLCSIMILSPLFLIYSALKNKSLIKGLTSVLGNVAYRFGQIYG